MPCQDSIAQYLEAGQNGAALSEKYHGRIHPTVNSELSNSDCAEAELIQARMQALELVE